MPDAEHDDFVAVYFIYENIRLDRQLKCSRKRSQSTEARIAMQSIGGRDDRDRHAARRGRVIARDVDFEIFQIVERRVGEPYLHFGRGNSVSVPQDKSQRRTSS